MDWFRPSSESISFLAEICLLAVILLYIFSFKGKTKDTRLYIGFLIVLFAWCINGFLYNSNIGSTPTGKDFSDWISSFLTPGLSIYILWFAYQFGHNPFRREMFMVIIICILLFNLPLLVEFDTASTLFIPVSIFRSSLHILTSLYSCIVLLRKIHRLTRNRSLGDQSVTGKQIFQNKNSFFNELRQPSCRETRAYKGLVVWAFIFFCIWVCYLAQITSVINYFVWAYSLHILLLVSIVQSTVVFLNFASERHSFQAKLVGVVLCVVMIIFGLLPYSLFGDGLPAASDPQLEARLKVFLVLIPVATVITVIILPLTFQYNILRQLEKVIEGVKQVNEGNLHTSVNAEVNDEIGTLSDQFNQMTKSLRTYASRMEELVAERTAELNQSLEDLRSTQAQLIQSEKMASLGELTAGIAHEIQNPLNFVNNFSEVSNELMDEMKTELSGGNMQLANEIAGDIKLNLEKINYHGKRADAIVKGMLQHSNNSSGQKVATDINALTDEYVRLTYNGMRAKDKSFNTTIHTDFDNNIGSINIAPQDIGRVILNLVSNAFYSVIEKQRQNLTGYEPSVSVITKKNNEKIEITVSDNGNGIPSKIMDKIFQPFFTTKPTGQGTGLGLSLAYDIVTKGHAGEIKVNTKDGEGTDLQ